MLPEFAAYRARTRQISMVLSLTAAYLVNKVFDWAAPSTVAQAKVDIVEALAFMALAFVGIAVERSMESLPSRWMALRRWLLGERFIEGEWFEVVRAEDCGGEEAFWSFASIFFRGDDVAIHGYGRDLRTTEWQQYKSTFANLNGVSFEFVFEYLGVVPGNNTSFCKYDFAVHSNKAPNSYVGSYVDCLNQKRYWVEGRRITDRNCIRVLRKDPAARKGLAADLRQKIFSDYPEPLPLAQHGRVSIGNVSHITPVKIP